MPEETPNPEENAEEADVEAEMLRMMQEEIEGGGEDTGEESAEEGLENVDDMLEQEMLRAMQEDTGEEAGLASFASQIPGIPENLEGIGRLSDIEVSVTVEIGENTVAIKDIMEWSPEEILELTAEEHDPVRILVNGKPFARGEVVVVGDSFGVRVTELVDQPELPR